MKRFLLIASLMASTIPLVTITMDKKPLAAELKKRYYVAIKNLTEHKIFLTVDNGDQQEEIFQIFPHTHKIEIFSVPLQKRPMVQVILPEEYYSNTTHLKMYGFREKDYFIIKKNAINPLCIDIQQATNEQLKEAYQ